MDGEGLDLDSDFPSKVKKCASRVDRISQLPDEILLVILSFLSLRRAAATSVLSSRWSDLWKHSPCLDFNPHKWGMGDHGGLCDEEFIKIVNSVIQSHKALSLKLFRIYFPIKNSAKSVVAKWLEFVFSRQVETLALVFTPVGDSVMVVLEESLRETSLICGAPQNLPFFQSLKRLLLKSLKVGGEDVELFLRNCPLLAELMIDSAVLTSDVEVCGTSDLKLKHLNIRDCKGEKSIKVSAPNLTWISFLRNFAKLLFENDVPRLKKAEFQTQDPDFVQQFPHISQLQFLFLKLYYPMAFWTNGFPHMPNLRELILVCCANNYNFLHIIALLWAYPCLGELSIKVYGNPQVPSVLVNGERSKHLNLQVFRMYGVPSVSDDIVELVIYILDNCVALRKVKINKQGWHPGDPITDEMRAAANDFKRRLQVKLVANHVQLHFFGCDIVL